MDSWIWSVLLFLIGVGMFVLLRKLRLRELRNVSIDATDAERLSVELLDYVKQKSYEPGRAVKLGPFWRGRGLTAGDKASIEGPLLESEVLLIRRETGFAADLADRFMTWAFIPLPQIVLLNPQEWRRMTQGISSTTIVAEVVDMRDQRDMRDQSITNTNYGGQQVNVQATGDDADASAHDITLGQTGLGPEHLVALSEALRRDADRLSGGDHEREMVLDLADEVDDETRAADQHPERIKRLFRRATQYAGTLAGGLENTSKLRRFDKARLERDLVVVR